MNDQLSRIASFIDSLGSDSIVGNEQSLLLSTDMNAIGGDNGKNCVNSTLNSCEGVKNGGNCMNYANTCSDSDNKGDCANTDFEMPNPLPANTAINCH